MKPNFVFDIDGAMAIPVDMRIQETLDGVKSKFGEEYFEKYCIYAKGYPHLVYPGYYELFQWLHSIGGNLYFFSSGVKERNIEFTQKFMEKSFGSKKVEYKVFSREDCIDTTHDREKSDIYQSFFYGQKKKKLGGIVVPEEELSNSLLIDDDSSYMTKGEEYNLILLRYSYIYLEESPLRDLERFVKFHKAFYLAGLFSKIFEVQKEKELSLIEAAKFVQIDSENSVLSMNFYYPCTNRIDYYPIGKQILNQINPTLDFYYLIPEPTQ